MSTRAVTVNDIWVGTSGWTWNVSTGDCLNGYVPNLQVGGQVVNFLPSQGFRISSPGLLEKNGTVFRRAVESHARDNGVPWVRFVKGERKVNQGRRGGTSARVGSSIGSALSVGTVAAHHDGVDHERQHTTARPVGHGEPRR